MKRYKIILTEKQLDMVTLAFDILDSDYSDESFQSSTRARAESVHNSINRQIRKQDEQRNAPLDRSSR